MGGYLMRHVRHHSWRLIQTRRPGRLGSIPPGHHGDHQAGIIREPWGSSASLVSIKSGVNDLRWSRIFGQFVKLIPTGWRTGHGLSGVMTGH